MNLHGKKVLVAMSGGVDSSVAAVMLHKMGATVIGITMKTFDHKDTGDIGKSSGCCNVEDFNDARQIAVRHGFKHFIIDLREEFGNWVVDDFINEYKAGRTPNPCVRCNTYIKWDALLHRADDLGCDYISTGHYANLREDDGRFIISRGRDLSKDQSYALWGVSQKHLSRTILPLGSYHKSEIRKMAGDWGLERVADKPDSYEICFIPDDDYRRFLVDTGLMPEDLSDGKIVNTDGDVIGTHDGYYNFTVGQRKGLKISNNDGTPHYVVHINSDDNEITVGSKLDLVSNDCIVKDVNWVKYDSVSEMEVVSKIRYNDEGASSIINPDGDKLRVHFPVGREAITPGQALVCYSENDVICGGWIESVNVNFDF